MQFFPAHMLPYVLVPQHIGFYLEMAPGTKRDRDAKIAHIRSLKESETTHSVRV